jgi:hypothetical protein
VIVDLAEASPRAIARGLPDPAWNREDQRTRTDRARHIESPRALYRSASRRASSPPAGLAV